MIPLPLLGAVGFLRRNWELFAIAIALVVWHAAFYRYAQGREAGEWKAVLATKEAAWSEERAKAAEASAAAERREREKEAEGQRRVAELEAQDAKKNAEWTERVRVLQDRVDGLAGSRKQLLEHIGRLTHHAVASAAGAEPGAACGDLPARLAAAGSLLERADSLAERCAVDYGKARHAWDLCTGYAEIVRPK